VYKRQVLLSLLFGVLLWQLRRGRERTFPSQSIVVMAGLSLATLAWNGHAAAGEGMSGIARLIAGIAHLLAAGAWIGAIAVILISLANFRTWSVFERQQVLWQTLHAFSKPGTVFVGVLVISGSFHYGDLTAWSGEPLLRSAYGRLLLFKLALFLAMLVLAALHRWWLVPQLERDIGAGKARISMHRLRSSIAVEASTAVLIVGSVAVLGTLRPHS